MYAEQFNAPTWLEEPAKWLWWAMQSRIAGNLEDALYNLREFWKAIEVPKASADEATWPEILAMDAQSHIQAANITSAIINRMEGDLSSAVAWATFWSPNMMKDYIGTTKEAARVSITRMQEQRERELQTASELAALADTAAAQRIEAVADGRLSQEDAERAQEDKQYQNIINRDRADFSIPWWAYVAGGLGLLFFLKGR
jgi:hypothetical protein